MVSNILFYSFDCIAHSLQWFLQLAIKQSMNLVFWSYQTKTWSLISDQLGHHVTSSRLLQVVFRSRRQEMREMISHVQGAPPSISLHRYELYSTPQSALMKHICMIQRPRGSGCCKRMLCNVHWLVVQVTWLEWSNVIGGRHGYDSEIPGNSLSTFWGYNIMSTFYVLEITVFGKTF